MEDPRFTHETAEWQKITEIRLDTLNIGDRIMLDSSTRAYDARVLEPGPAGEAYVRLTIGKKNNMTGSVEEWWQDSDLVELMGACLRAGPPDKGNPVTEPELGVLRLDRRAWYRADRKALGRRIDVITDIIDSIAYSPSQP